MVPCDAGVVAMSDFLLPDVGEGLTEAEIVAWHVVVGDVVAVNQVLVEIETAKSVVELPSPFAGTVTALLAEVGETVSVGRPIVSVGGAAASPEPGSVGAPTAPEDSAPEDPSPEHPAPEDPSPTEIDLSNPGASGGAAGESLVGRTKADRGAVRRRRRAAASPSTVAGAATQMQVQGAFAPGGAQSQDVDGADEQPVPVAPVGASTAVQAEAGPGGVPEERGGAGTRPRPRAKPSVRGLARERDVDLVEVHPSGPEGTVTRGDVLRASGRPDGAPATPATPAVLAGVAPAGGETRRPLTGVGRAMARAMAASAFGAPHVTEWITVDVSATTRLVEQVNRRTEFAGLRVTPLLVLAKACLLAMRRTPEINSTFDAEAGEVVLKPYVNLGIAAATPRGLVVPCVRDADQLDLLGLGRAIGELVEAAREGRPRPADLSGGTFTITNVGVFGVDAGTPIINPGESAILAFGAVAKRPWVDQASGELVVRDVATLALSFDHRHVDGQMGSRFLTDVAGVLRDPGTALLL